MAISFTRAPEVAAGDRVTSTEHALLARAFNDRLRSGLGDGTWRLAFWMLNLFRQVRNSDGLWSFPPQGEFWNAYQHVTPGAAEWPTAEAGGPEGANVANPLMAFVFGVEPDLSSESDRLNEPTGPVWFPRLLDDLTDPAPVQLWLVAQQQRGAYDPYTGELGSPAFTAARSHFSLASQGSQRSPYLNAWGGWMPAAPVNGTCDDPNPSDEYPPPVSYGIKFTNLHDGSVLSYPGTCVPVPGGEPYDGHVLGLQRLPWGYVVWLNDGTVTTLPAEDWIEGPYTDNARLGKTEGGQLPRVLNAFAREFRGNTGQRAQAGYHLQEAFDFQRFLSTQYHLAPALGQSRGGGLVTPTYPRWQRAPGNHAKGALLPCSSHGGTRHAWTEGFVATACIVVAQALQASCILELVDNGTVVRTLECEPDELGNWQELVIFSEAVRFTALEVRWGSLGQIGAGGFVIVELTELAAYLPQLHDAYLVLRLGGAELNWVNDGSGDWTATARAISEDYHRYGCALVQSGTNTLPDDGVQVNQNGVYEAARQLSLCVRSLPRWELSGYAVENGVSVLWFRRYALGLSHSIRADSFAGLAPRATAMAAGEIAEGVVYEVRTGSVTYAGQTYAEGERFTGVAGEDTAAGGGEVFEADGIRHTAPPRGWTNEWVLEVDLLNYHPSDSSIWKPEAYSDYFALGNRCHFYSPELSNDPQWVWQASYGQRVSGLNGGVVIAETPPGWHYAPLTASWLGRSFVNHIECDPADTPCREARENFYRSCRLYEPPVEVDRAEIEIGTDGEEYVKLTLTGRLHHAESAPSSIDRDRTTWDFATISAEEYRTAENGLREYLLNQDGGVNCSASAQMGNAAANSSVWSLPDSPYGACYPRVRLTKLVPSPYEDGNDSPGGQDTRIVHDPFPLMDLYLRAMCEGYVDGQTSADYACQYGATGVYHFTFENLCFQAFGGRWLRALPEALTPENPQGHGPLPNTGIFAETFNQFAQAVNLLDTVPVMLPLQLQVREDAGTRSHAVEARGLGGGGVAHTSGQVQWLADYGGQDATATAGSWADASGGNAQLFLGVTGDAHGGGWELEVTRTAAQFRWNWAHAEAAYAVPEAWRDMVQENAVVLLSVSRLVAVPRWTITADAGAATGCPSNPVFLWALGGGDYYEIGTVNLTDETTCSVAGSISAPSVPGHTLGFARNAALVDCPQAGASTASATAVTTSVGLVRIPIAEGAAG